MPGESQNWGGGEGGFKEGSPKGREVENGGVEVQGVYIECEREQNPDEIRGLQNTG